jgi:1-acyl-sn-glycerol-3-phosphate acyltransferase
MAFFWVIMRNDKMFHHVGRTWGKVLCFFAGVKLNVVGSMPADSECVYMSNHTSDFDIPILLAVLKDDFRIIYKQSLEKIFLFGWLMKASPYISIERDNPQKAGRSLIKAIEVMKTGASILIFPEGTRQHDGVFKPLKRGGFQIAKKSGKPIVPIAISNAYKIQPEKFTIVRTNVNVWIGDENDINEIKSCDNEIDKMNMVYEKIKNHIIHEK